LNNTLRLVALLKESEEIKQKKPFYNSAQKRTYFQYGLFTDQQIDGYIRLEMRKIREGSLPLTAYASRKEGVDHLYYLNDQFQLCLSLTGLNKGRVLVFTTQLKNAMGLVLGKKNQKNITTELMRP